MDYMNTFLDSIVQPFAECLTRDLAHRILELRAEDLLQSRVDELADKSNAGTISDDERREYDRYLAAYHFVTRMQLSARRFLGS